VRAKTIPGPGNEPVDVNNVLFALASDEARYVHGVALPVYAGACVKSSRRREAHRLSLDLEKVG
jgi:hypothetical protein